MMTAIVLLSMLPLIIYFLHLMSKPGYDRKSADRFQILVIAHCLLMLSFDIWAGLWYVAPIEAALVVLNIWLWRRAIRRQQEFDRAIHQHEEILKRWDDINHKSED